MTAPGCDGELWERQYVSRGGLHFRPIGASDLYSMLGGVMVVTNVCGWHEVICCSRIDGPNDVFGISIYMGVTKSETTGVRLSFIHWQWAGEGDLTSTRASVVFVMYHYRG